MSDACIEIHSETARVRAALVNSGRHTFAEADTKLAASRLLIILGEDAANTPAGQAALLTAIVTSTRSFGQVFVQGPVDQVQLLAVPAAARTLRDAIAFFGAKTATAPSGCPQIVIGTSPTKTGGWSVQAFWDGWTAGTTPSAKPVNIGLSDCPLAGIAAGALAVGQAFLSEQGDVRAGRTNQTLSLWSPGNAGKFDYSEPPLFNRVLLPASLWLVGLGNLGQAYLWSLTLLPYSRPEDVKLFLQDDQKIERENWGTSILVERGRYGFLKTRLTEEWASGRGFEVRRIDRRLDEHFLRLEHEPGIALAGLDTMPARRLLGLRGFEYIIDAGLGATFIDYRKLRINVFNSKENPAEHFRDVEDLTMQTVQALMDLPAYQELGRHLGDGGCGAAMLAASSVAVPFVSAIAGALAITQAIRIASGYAHHVAITGDVSDIRSLRATIGAVPARTIVPGIQPVTHETE